MLPTENWYFYLFVYWENITIPSWEGLHGWNRPIFNLLVGVMECCHLSRPFLHYMWCSWQSEVTHMMQSSFLLSGSSARCHLVSLTPLLFWSGSHFTGQIVEYTFTPGAWNERSRAASSRIGQQLILLGEWGRERATESVIARLHPLCVYVQLKLWDFILSFYCYSCYSLTSSQNKTTDINL